MRINLSSQIDRIVFVYGLVRRSISNGGSHSSMAESSFFFFIIVTRHASYAFLGKNVGHHGFQNFGRHSSTLAFPTLRPFERSYLEK